MKADLIYITSDVTFADLRDEKYSKPEILQRELDEWLFRPLQLLGEASAGDFRGMGVGMAMLLLELTFFEHHGQYITGKDSDLNAARDVRISSRDAFTSGFDAFRNYLVSAGHGNNDLATLDARNLYKFGRCGLFHSFNLRWEFLIDARQQSASFERNVHQDVGGWLINPWQLRIDLTYYTTEYVKTLVSPTYNFGQPAHTAYPADLRQKFLTTFDRIHALEVYTGSS
jgi:hypothetical protein